jgi:uncharacterized phage-associated protein
MRKKHKTYTMTPNHDKIREALLHVISVAHKKNISVTQYDLVKTFFLADRAHLNEYGRPITYDNYVAMKHGPVASFTYRVLKSEEAALKSIGGALWSVKTEGNLFYYTTPQRGADTDFLSESDLEKLSWAFETVKSLGFGQIRKLTHEDVAWVDAWEDESDKKSFPMSYALLFDSVDDEMAEQIAFASAHV